MGMIEALYFFDEHNNVILQHVYCGRPPSAKNIIPLYLARPVPRPSLIYFTETNPATLVYSVIHDRILFLATSSTDIEPLLVLEFIHRVISALEDFLGSPLLASRIEASFDVVAQLLGEICDAGLIATTEPNALRDVVDVPSWMGKLLSGVALPGAPPALSSSSRNPPLQTPLSKQATSSNGSTTPWRRSNVRHTSNELYVDVIENLSVTIAPSSRLIAAFAHGTIAFNCKVSGIPDLLLTMSAPGGKSSVSKVIEHPTFHPCVRLARWRERPGELSFVPPDGRFVLASYGVDLIPDNSFTVEANDSNVRVPATAEIRTCLGPQGSDFEVELSLSDLFRKSPSTSSSQALSGVGASGLGARISATSAAFGTGVGTSTQPTLESVSVSIPVPVAVRNISDLRAAIGEAHYSPRENTIEWNIGNRDIGAVTINGRATLCCSVVGSLNDDNNEVDYDQAVASGLRLHSDTLDYTDSEPYQSKISAVPTNDDSDTETKNNAKSVKQNALLMPTSAMISFSVKGWLASGLRVDSLVIDTKASKGLGAGVTPYKGVKYLTVSRKSVEVRC